MIDDTPYIIIDNQKIAPVSRASRLISSSADKPNRKDRPFGVVDRVTISREAMEKYQQLQAQVEAEPPAIPYSSRKTLLSTIPLLTDSSTKRH